MTMFQSFKEIEVTLQGEIVIIKFNRPAVMNCISPLTHKELVAIWGYFKSNPKLKVAIITGEGEQAFCAGADLKAALEGQFVGADPKKAIDEDGDLKISKDGIIGPSRWTDIYKPIIAAVNGVAYAGGLEWACFADMRIVEEHASFGVTCRRWNIGLGDGGTQRLPRIIGMGRAMELILTGKVIDAQEAYRIGLANEVVPKGKSLKRAIELAEFLCTLPQPAMRTDKEAAVRGYGMPLEDGLQIEARLFYQSIGTDETIEGLRQFAERDHPDRREGDQKTPGLIRSK